MHLSRVNETKILKITHSSAAAANSKNEKCLLVIAREMISPALLYLPTTTFVLQRPSIPLGPKYV